MDILIRFALSGFFSVVPMVFYLVVIWFMDRYEREPFWLVGLHFMWGATGAIMFGIIGSMIMGVGLSEFIIQFASRTDAQKINTLAGAVVVAPLVEECAKGVFVLVMSVNRNFDGPIDGAVYGGAVGLGFGMTENFLYFMSYGKTIESLLTLIIIRTLFSAVLHCCTQATFGAAIGFAKFRSPGVKLLVIPLGLITAMFIHFMWNLTVSFQSTELLGFVFMIVLVTFYFIAFQFGVYHEGKIILKELTDESNTTGYIPKAHLAYLPYTSRRFKKGWLPPTVDQRAYVKASVKLAFRKHQVKHMKGNSLASYQADIDSLRRKIYSMLFTQKQPVNEPQLTPSPQS